jgi:hypothetical protein
MKDNKQLIWYEEVHCKIHWNYTSLLKDDFEIIKVSELKSEIRYCYGSNQYIMSFIEVMKNRVIRLLPNLSDVEIIIGVFDRNNILHRLIIGAYYLINNMLKREIHKKNFYKTIITIIKYKGEIVFMGEISFDGIE